MGFLANLELGAAGVADLATKAASTVTAGIIPESHLAADVYQAQTPQTLPNGKPNPGAFPDVAAAAQAEDANSIVTEAASKTVDQVADVVEKAASSTTKILIVAGIIAGVAVLAYAVHEVRSLVK